MWKTRMMVMYMKVIVSITLFVSNALPIDCAPSFPNWLESKLSDVSVCIWYVSYKSWKTEESDCRCYFICFQCFTNVVCTSWSDLIRREFKWCKCLCQICQFKIIEIQKRVIVCVTLFVSNASPIDCAPVSPICFL